MFQYRERSYVHAEYHCDVHDYVTHTSERRPSSYGLIASSLFHSGETSPTLCFARPILPAEYSMRIVSGHRRALLGRSLSRRDKGGVDDSPLALSLKNFPIYPLPIMTGEFSPIYVF